MPPSSTRLALSTLLLWTWELPQSLLGLLFLALQRQRGRVHGVERMPDGRRLVQTEGIGVSLGAVVYWSRWDARGAPFQVPLIRAHELGHTIQSRRLGWLYLPTVGVASVSRVVWSRLHYARTGRPWAGYFDAWPERSADVHGGIFRDARGRRCLPPEGSPLDPHCPMGPGGDSGRVGARGQYTGEEVVGVDHQLVR